MSISVLAMWMPGPLEWVVIVVVALLIFGRRLPDVARSVGKSIVEFKRGMRDVKDDLETQSRLDASRPSELPGNGGSQPKSTSVNAPESTQKSTSHS